MGALLAIILSAGFPPSDEGPGCEAWTATRAGELARAPQPEAAALGAEVPGLAELDERIWKSFAPRVPSHTEQNGERFAAALDGRAAMSTAPELVETARGLEVELGKPGSLPAAGEFIDLRTGRALIVESRGESVSLVAPGDPTHAAQEIRVQLSEPR